MEDGSHAVERGKFDHSQVASEAGEVKTMGSSPNDGTDATELGYACCISRHTFY